MQESSVTLFQDNYQLPSIVIATSKKPFFSDSSHSSLAARLLTNGSEDTSRKHSKRLFSCTIRSYISYD